MDKPLINKKQFINNLPTGSVNMSGLPQFHRFNNKFFNFLKSVKFESTPAPPMEKALINEKQFINTFPTGFEYERR
jgi:hypothetical protein